MKETDLPPAPLLISIFFGLLLGGIAFALIVGQPRPCPIVYLEGQVVTHKLLGGQFMVTRATERSVRGTCVVQVRGADFKQTYFADYEVDPVAKKDR